MTAVDLDALDAARARLSAALLAATTDYGTGKAAPEVDLFDFYAAALLPVVRALVAEGAAKELRAAADWLEGDPDKGGAPLISGNFSVLFADRLDIAQAVSWAAASIRDRAKAVGEAAK